MNKKQFSLLAFGIIAITFIITHNYSLNTDMLVDESTHAWIISNFYNGKFELLPHLTVLPGYHALCAIFEKFIAFSDTLATKRLFSTIIGFFSILVFYFLHKKIHNDKDTLKSLQLSYLPLLFPFFFLIYTDIPSLFFVLLGLLCFHYKRYSLMGIFALISVLMRQSNIIWVGYLAALTVFENHESIKITLFEPLTFVKIKELIKKNLFTIITIIAFIIFIKINGGIALGDKQQHPSFSFKLGNLYLFISLALLLYLPIFISEAKNVFKKIKPSLSSIKGIIITIPVIIAAYIIYDYTFQITHAYNSLPLYNWVIRNISLHFIANHLWAKILFFIAIFYGSLVLIFAEFKNHKEKILYLSFATLSLIPFWLIEVRYAIIAMVLFTLYRVPKNKYLEITQLIYNILLSGILFYTIINTIYFP